MHVAHRVEVDARGDQRDQAEHADGQRVDVVPDGQTQLAEDAEQIVLAGVIQRLPVGVGGNLVCLIVRMIRRRRRAVCGVCVGRRVMRRVFGKVIPQPEKQGHEGQHPGGGDRTGGDVRTISERFAEPRPDQQQEKEGRQRQQRRQPQQPWQRRGFHQPFKSSA